jgi:hypothetical protein
MDQLAKSKTLSPKKPERKGLEVGLKWRASESPKFKPQQWEKKKKRHLFSFPSCCSEILLQGT